MGYQLTLFDDFLQCKSFEDELVEKALLQGIGFGGVGSENWREQIYEFVIVNKSIDKLAKFLKHYKGVGGSSRPCKEPYVVFGENHDERGIEYRWHDDRGNEVMKKISWNKAAEIFIGMMVGNTEKESLEVHYERTQ